METLIGAFRCKYKAVVESGLRIRDRVCSKPIVAHSKIHLRTKLFDLQGLGLGLNVELRARFRVGVEDLG